MSAPTEADLARIIFAGEAQHHTPQETARAVLAALSGCWIDPETNTPRETAEDGTWGYTVPGTTADGTPGVRWIPQGKRLRVVS